MARTSTHYRGGPGAHPPSPGPPPPALLDEAETAVVDARARMTSPPQQLAPAAPDVG
ncbi:hypothetical protein SLV14_006454 [Streptomyces sp. Je 1-4]|uniref:hypothetical protein n=1 Tax=Streptomyces TaxID=1883 RepID=UPI0021D9755E|nr:MULTISPECIES: hypothetical protein [unclassified Streptomyces]UYB43478.1 hypothetical protein SLV14_006454 [Streptomyces sp. Je 1-4]UZQ39858.1 hypothetical protein SLV14N_006454 [Streptomyces sp. Je 1-4] [Streptomyces sp. Je 1-4 4N24]UZQ47275.1 hypothetical protein SLV14NA_006454 [Streptomyces sp. Je 1-4] [Streptomyces sp. Je 1-4 4N24_ara]